MILPLLFGMFTAASAFGPGARAAVSTALHAEAGSSGGVKRSDYMLPAPAAGLNPKPTAAQISAFGIQITADHESGPYESMTRTELKELIKLQRQNSALMVLRFKLKGRSKKSLISTLSSATTKPPLKPLGATHA
jgi:hypothetical protein